MRTTNSCGKWFGVRDMGNAFLERSHWASTGEGMLPWRARGRLTCAPAQSCKPQSVAMCPGAGPKWNSPNQVEFVPSHPPILHESWGRKHIHLSCSFLLPSLCLAISHQLWNPLLLQLVNSQSSFWIQLTKDDVPQPLDRVQLPSYSHSILPSLLL